MGLPPILWIVGKPVASLEFDDHSHCQGAPCRRWFKCVAGTGIRLAWCEGPCCGPLRAFLTDDFDDGRGAVASDEALLFSYPGWCSGDGEGPLGVCEQDGAFGRTNQRPDCLGIVVKG